MKKLQFIFTITMLSIVGNLLNAQTLSPLQITAIENAITEEMKIAGIPGGALAIINNNQVVFEKSFGFANSQTKIELTDSSIFQIASVTKIFTALTILKELDDANIGVHESVGKVIGGLSPKVSSITFHQLLTHTSGLIDYTNESDNTEVYEFFKNIGDTILFIEPGKVFSYSNIGYALLGFAIEQLAGIPYPEAVSRAVLRPLKLKNTSFDLYEVSCKTFSAGHILNNGLITPALSHYDVPLLQAAGGIFSNMQDLERLTLFLMNNGVLDGVQVYNQKIIEQMSLPHSNNFMAGAPSYFGFLNFPKNAYGHGLFMFEYNNLHFVGNAGSGTQLTFLLYEPEAKFSIIIVSNKAWETMFNSIGKIIEVVLGEKELLSTDFKPNSEEWDEITGKYFLPAYKKNRLSSVEIFEKDEKLYINFDESGDTELEQIGKLVYKYSSPYSRFPMVISFHRDESKNIAYLRNVWRTWVKTK